MPRASATAPAMANIGGAVPGINNTQSGYLNSAIAQCLRALFPRKTWAHMVGPLGITERVAKHRMAGERDFTAEELARLLRSEHGLDFLTAIMADARPKWWRLVQQHNRIATARRLEAAARREIQDAIDEDADLNAAISRADALLIQDENFYRPHADAARAVLRVSHRALAAGAKKA